MTKTNAGPQSTGATGASMEAGRTKREQGPGERRAARGGDARITAIEIENFKGISARQRIELSPLTLLFGANSAGKSTLLHALLYSAELVLEHNPDADVTYAAGGAVRLGGFTRLVHDRDRKRSLSLALSFTMDGVLDPPLAGASQRLRAAHDALFGDTRRAPLAGMDDEIDSLSVGYSVRWPAGRRRPQVHRVTLGVNDAAPCLVVEAGPETRGCVTLAIDPRASLWRWLPGGPDSPPRAGSRDEPHPLLARWLSKIALPRDPQGRYLLRAVAADALGFGADALTLDVTGIEAGPELLSIHALLNKLLGGSLNALRSQLSGLVYIGPLRAVPPGDIESVRAAFSWGDGRGAWAACALNDTLREQTNLALARVGCPYKLELCGFGGRSLEADDEPPVEEGERAVRLRDVRSRRVFRPTEVGVGVSQLMPVLASLTDRHEGEHGIVMIEQPELHLHPALQVKLGDELRRGAENRLVLVETHSEHIILRLLRRIRETADKTLPAGVAPYQPDQLSVLYVDSDERGVHIKPLGIDRSGEFVDRWPSGFFAERGEELF